VNDLPVYGDRDQLQRVATQLEQARAAVPGHDLAAILAQAQYRPIRDAIADIEVLYVPLEQVGCVFQAMRRLPPVIKK
jgi:hypothetical protein